MSQASPVKEQAGVGDSMSKASRGSRPKPPRYPSFSFRRALSGAQSRTKGEDTLPTMSESEGPEGRQDGKLTHVRVTLGYLKAIERIEKSSRRKHKDTSLVTAFASLADSNCQHTNYAPSLPLRGASPVNNVVWPKQKERAEDGVDKSNRRLYFSTTLQRDDDEDDLKNLLAREDDLSTVTGTSAWDKRDVETFQPKLMKIQLGVARGMDLLHLGVATLVVDGTDVSSKQLDLPVRTLLPGEDDSNSADKSSSQKRRGLKRLFGKKSKAAKTSFEADAYEYRLSSNAILRIRVDVISDSTPLARVSLSGPAVWGDGVEDDNDSFASIVVMDMGRDESSALKEGAEVGGGSQRGDASTAVVEMGADTSESIEVVNNPTGPSIISPAPPPAPLAPLKFEQPNVTNIETQESSILPVTSVDVEPQNPTTPRIAYHGENPSKLTMFQTTGMLCGFTDPFNPPGIEADMSSLDFEDSSTIATSHYNGTRAEAWKLAAGASQSTATSGILRRTSLGTVDERSEDNTSRPSRLSTSRASASRTSALLPSSMSRKQLAGDSNISIGEDTMKSLDEAKKALQCYAERTGEDYHSMLEHLDIVSSADLMSLEPSIGEDTIDSVFEAKELLQSYAGKIGLDVQDLLEVDLSNLATFSSSPSSTLSPSSSKDETVSKSSKSRFSLFVDD